MNLGTKLIVVAVLALLAGSAFASPLLIFQSNVKPFPRVPEGRKADFSVALVYASFNVQENASTQSSGDSPWSNATYMVVLNITNLSEIEAKIASVGFAAAQHIAVVPSALGGYSFARTEGSGGSSGGVVEGVWLDDEWINVTWIPDTDYPYNLFRVLTPDPNTTTIVPDLPANASEEGTWMEGVPITEYHNSTAIRSTSLYINGSWVDVTGRVRASPEQPLIMATSTLVDEIMPFEGEHYRNAGNASVGPITEMPSWQMYGDCGPTYQWPKTDGFNNTWGPHQSRLIVLTGTQDLGVNLGIPGLSTGRITLYATASTYVNDWLVNGTYYDTLSTATWLNKVQLENAANGYLYNTVLGENQEFLPDQYGIEVFVEPRN